MSITLDQALAVLRPHLGAAPFLVLETKVAGLKPGRHAATILDWASMPPEERSYFTEQRAMPLFEEHGRAWHEKLVPLAVLGGENHPVEDFDEQCDGLLLLDTAAGAAVVFNGYRAYPFATSVTALALVEG